MGLSELPYPATKEQCIETARAYAEQLKSSPRLRTLAELRLKDEVRSAPDWFIQMVDVEVSIIIHRINSLEGWKPACDPWHSACETGRFIYWAHLMLHRYLNPWLMDAHNTGQVAGYLQAIKNAHNGEISHE